MYPVTKKSTIPFAVVPVAPFRVVNPEIEAAAAEVANDLGLPFVQNVFSSLTVEDLASRMPKTSKWIELYPFANRRVSQQIVVEAEKFGFEAVVITVSRLEKLDFTPLEGISANYESAIFRELVNEELVDVTENLVLLEKKTETVWEYVKWLIGETRLPVIVKGTFNEADIERAVAAGVAGICFSKETEFFKIQLAKQLQIPFVISGDVICEKEATGWVKCGANLVMIELPIQWGYVIDEKKGIKDIFRIYINNLASQ